MIRVRVRDRDHIGYKGKHKLAKFRDVYRKGKYVYLEDKPLELFRLSVLAEALDRTNRGVLHWEEKGLFPRALFALHNPDGKYNVRWYSAAQVVNLNNLYHLKYDGRKQLHWPLYGTRAPLMSRFYQFFEDVRVIFYKSDVIDTEWFKTQNRSFST